MDVPCSSQKTTDRVRHYLKHGRAVSCFAFTEDGIRSCRVQISLNTTRPTHADPSTRAGTITTLAQACNSAENSFNSHGIVDVGATYPRAEGAE
jgi:hypothetical protein